MARTEDVGVAPSEVTESRAALLSRIALGVLLALASAVLNVVAHPPYALGPLVLVMLVPMLVAELHVMPRRLAGVPLAIAIAGPAWWGIANIVPSNADAFVQAAPFVLAVLLLILGPLDRWLMERTRYRFFVFAVPFVWGATAMMISNGPTGSIGTSANAMHRLPWLIQPVSVVGSIGLILAIYLVNWALGAIVLGLLGHRWLPRRRIVRIGTVTVVITAVWVAASVLMMRSPDPAVRVAAIQPGGFFRPDIGAPASAAFERFEGATKRAASDGAQVVVWTEGGLPFDPRVVETDRLRALARETKAYIAVGYGIFDDRRMRNEAILVTPEGRILGPYAKQHPVTFLGERSESDHGYPVFDTDVGRMALLICFDMDFFDTPRRMARQGAGLLAVPSNDWPEIADVHYPSFVMRAIENRVSIVKADTAWDSAIIDPYGRVLRKKISPEGASATLVADVPIGSGRTVAASIGDLNGLVVVVAALAMLVLVIVRARRVDTDAPTPDP